MSDSDSDIFITQSSFREECYNTDTAEDVYLDLRSDGTFQSPGTSAENYQPITEDISDNELSQAVDEIENSFVSERPATEHPGNVVEISDYELSQAMDKLDRFKAPKTDAEMQEISRKR